MHDRQPPRGRRPVEDPPVRVSNPRPSGEEEASARSTRCPDGPLVPAGDEAFPVVLREIAVRAITTLVFPEILPDAGQGTGQHTIRDTGRFWPVVRGTLQESARSQVTAKTAGARARLWSAAVAQLFLHRGNILSTLGLFGVAETKEGSGQDPRSLKELLLGAEAGDATARAALVQRMVPALMHAPEPFITPGQGSEAGEGKGAAGLPPVTCARAEEPGS
ncbi:hypothetical protein [Streptomyces sp. NPDC059909]|uniref:hypothetical protein n=1 Tax=Streptomyces sp. NPDC059909 TaxID=3346998 RepID=UPI003654C20C